MCGIAGVVAGNGHALEPEAVERMIRTLAHRGPDSLTCQSYGEGRAALAHARLAIIDLSTGDQPMTTEDGAIGLVFNGEIYNYVELKRDLQSQGVRFTTNSDTEVILRLYERMGSSGMHLLRGMFAFAIYDDRSQKLLLARDRLGKKPLYYAARPEGLVFASELKAVLAYLPAAPAVDWSFLEEYLALGYIPEPATPFAGIRKLPAASLLQFSEGGLEIRPYWKPPTFQAELHDEAETLRQLEDTLRESVEIRLRSDVDFGSLLSGGIDSSLVTALMSKSLPRKVKTFSVGFADKDHNELDAAGAVARHLSTDHSHELLHIDVASVLPRVAWHMDEPFADSSAIPTYYVCSMAAKHVRMVLSGDGGDELFAGYKRYRRVLQLELLRSIPFASSGALLASRLKALPRLASHARRLARYLRAAPEASYAQLVGIFPPEEIVALGLTHPAQYPPSCIAAPWRSGKGPDLNRAMFTDLQSYLRDDVLVKVDRMAMAHSLEVRSPLLDHILLELAARIPVQMKRKRLGPGKRILRKLAGRYLPDHIIRMPKHGFSAPVDAWYREGGPLRPELLSELGAGGEPLSILSRQRIDGLLAACDRRVPAVGEALFTIHTLFLWHRLYVRELQTSLRTFQKGRVPVTWQAKSPAAHMPRQ